MTRNKDQKRIIRARMKKTGESYTAARAVVVSKRQSGNEDTATVAPAAADAASGAASRKAGSNAGAYAAPRSQWPALAGSSDEAVRRKTGRTWAEWVEALDAAGAHRMSHADIARHVGTYEGVSGWWAQMVTVGYERIRGLRDVGQRRDGAYEANKSRTFAAGVSTLYRMFADARRRKGWLPAGVKRVRTATADKSMRLDWHDGTQVHLYFTAKGPARSSVSVQHVKLASKSNVAAAKEAWGERLDRLGEAIGKMTT